MSDLLITRLSHSSASVRGGLEMVLLCEKITKGKLSMCLDKFKVLPATIYFWLKISREVILTPMYFLLLAQPLESLVVGTE